jgi:hypothetical protein
MNIFPFSFFSFFLSFSSCRRFSRSIVGCCTTTIEACRRRSMNPESTVLVSL